MAKEYRTIGEVAGPLMMVGGVENVNIATFEPFSFQRTISLTSFWWPTWRPSNFPMLTTVGSVI